MSDKSDFSQVYHSGTAKQSKSLDPCSSKKNADCIGSCHLEVNEYNPSQFKRLSNQQKLKNLQLFGAKNLKSVRCKSRHGRNLAAKASGKAVAVRSTRAKAVYAGSQYCPKFAGRYAGGGKESCEAASRPDGRSCLWVKKGRKCRVKAQKKIYESKYKDSECNPLSKKRDCDGKFGKNLGCRWYKSRKSPKSQKNKELYGHQGCWSTDASKFGGESTGGSLRAAQKLLANDFVVPAGSCQGLALTAGSVNDAYHKCYSRSNCKISKKTKKGGNKLNNLRCIEIPGSYAKKRGGVFGKLRGLAGSGSLASRIASAGSSPPKSPASAGSSMSARTAMASGIGSANYDAGGMFDFNSKRKSRKSKRRRRTSCKSRKSKRRRRSGGRKSRKSKRRRRSRKSRKSKRRRRSRKSRKSKRRRRSGRRKSRRRSSKRKSKCRSCHKKKQCDKSKKFKSCSWRKGVGCVKKSRRHRFGTELH